MRILVRYAVLLATAMVIQRGLFAQIRLDDVSLDALLVLSVAAGITSGAERGAMVGFAAGCALDVFLITPFGLGALSCLVAGVLAGALESMLVHSARWLTRAVAFVSSALSLLFFAVFGTVIGESGLLTGHLPMIMLIVSASTAVLVLPVCRACRWADADSLQRAAIH